MTSEDKKMTAEEVATRTGQPVWKDGVRLMKDPTPLQVHSSQQGLLETAAKYTRGPQTQSQAQYFAQEAAYGDRKAPVHVVPTITDWTTLVSAGYPRLPIDPATGDVISRTYQAPSRLPSMSLSLPSLGSIYIRSIVSKAFDAVKYTVPKVTKYAVGLPYVLLQLGAAGYTIYKNWHYLGPIV